MNTQNKTAVEKLEEAKRTFARLSDLSRRIQVELEAARRQLQDAQDEAKTEYGTSNLEELRTLFRQREEQNQASVDAFCQALSEAEIALTKTERALNS